MAQKVKIPVTKSHARSGDAMRAVIVGGALVGVSVLAYVIGTGGHKSSLRETAFAKPQQKSEDFATGAVVLVPTIGDECRHKTIDNRTWTIQDHGAISCNEALDEAKKAGARRGPTRIDIIRDSFRK